MVNSKTPQDLQWAVVSRKSFQPETLVANSGGSPASHLGTGASGSDTQVFCRSGVVIWTEKVQEASDVPFSVRKKALGMIEILFR